MSGTEYYQAIQEHLESSAKLIVICSPEARKSDYVNDEIRRFTKVNDPKNIIPVLIHGTPNNLIKKGQEEDRALLTAIALWQRDTAIKQKNEANYNLAVPS